MLIQSVSTVSIVYPRILIVIELILPKMNRGVFEFFDITFLNEEDLDLSYLYWIPKLHKNPYKKRNIEGSYKFWQSLKMVYSLIQIKFTLHLISTICRFLKSLTNTLFHENIQKPLILYSIIPQNIIFICDFCTKL